MLTLGGSLALGATKTWDGGQDLDGFWSTGENWDPSTLPTDGTAPVAGDDLVFDGSTNLFPESDLGASFAVESITFPATADAFQLSGDSLAMNGKTITNESIEEQVIYNTIEESGSGLVIDGSGDLYLDDIQCSAWGHNFVKNGSGTVEVGNRNDSWQIKLYDGTVNWSETSGNGIAKTSDIHGGTLELTGGVNPIHYNATVNMQNDAATTDATLSLPATTPVKFKDLHGAAGSYINSLGTIGETGELQLRANSDFAGTIEDSFSGGKTAVTMLNEIGSQTLTLSGANTFTGNLTVQSSAAVSLTSTGELTFLPEPGGVCNKVTGAGSASLDGLFFIDLGSVGSPTSGDSWTLVDAAATYGSNFAVDSPFAETSPGVWSYDDGSDTYYFSETSGTLSYGRTAETVWTGGGGDALWSTVANWDQMPLTGDLLIFDGSVQTTNMNDLDTNYVPEDDTDPENIIPADPATFFVGGIRFDATADPFTLQGNGIDFVDKTITNNSANTQTLEMEVQCDASVGTGGFTVDAAAGDVVLNSLSIRNGYSKPLVKIGSETLTINGPLVGPDTWNPKVNEGTMVAAWTGGNLFFHTDIASGATLQTEGNVIHNGGRVSNNGTLDLAENTDEDVGALYGNGVITNHGAGGTTSTISTRQGDDRTFSGTIEDGPSGGRTAVQVGLAGRSETGTLTLSGSNSYTGNTTMGQEYANLILSSSSSSKFAPGANGVCNQITALVDQNTGTGTVDISGNFIVDLSGADITDGNAWTLVDVANLNETFGGSFQINNGAYVPPASTAVNCGDGTYGDFGEDDAIATGGGTYDNTHTINSSGVVNPAPDEVYQSERNGDHSYTFSGLSAGADYTVRLHFAEIYHSTTGQRVMDVTINGVLELDAWDLIAAAEAIYGVGNGKDAAVIEEFTVAADPSGNITVAIEDDVTAGDANAKISGIEITPVSGGGSNFVADTPAADQWQMVDGDNTWTFDEATGILSLAVGSGGGGGYADWLTGYPSLTLTGRNEDDENDGRDNVFEFYTDGDPTVSDRNLDPQASQSAGTFTFTFQRNDDAEGDTTGWFCYGSDLGNLSKEMVPTASATVGAVNFTVTENGTDPDDITAEVPTGGANEFFGRLGVE